MDLQELESGPQFLTLSKKKFILKSEDSNDLKLMTGPIKRSFAGERIKKL